MSTIVPEIDEIVNFYTPEILEAVARETGFAIGIQVLEELSWFDSSAW